jgi:hypothetical protein
LLETLRRQCLHMRVGALLSPASVVRLLTVQYPGCMPLTHTASAGMTDQPAPATAQQPTICNAALYLCAPLPHCEGRKEMSDAGMRLWDVLESTATNDVSCCL